MLTIGRGKEVSLYFHIPFCSKKCPYCHFFVLPDKTSFKEAFLKGIALEWAMRRSSLEGKEIVSIYFGGGTPSRLSPQQLEEVLGLVRKSGVSIAEDCEITLEANPEDVSEPLMRAFSALGINRVSLGIQSLEMGQLALLERQHDAFQGIKAIEQTSRAGISNISIDLMYDLPRQSLESWKRTLSYLKQLPIQHLSLYNLVIEPHTVFFKRRQELIPQLPQEEESLSLLEEALSAIEEAGLCRYEISAFARPGYTSRHNTGYWIGRPFLGFGPSAFSYWEGKRFSNVAHLNRYLEALERGESPVDFEEQLTYPHNVLELFAVQLRLIQGVDLQLFQSAHGSFPKSLFTCLEKLAEFQWVKWNSSHCALTPLGMRFYDSVGVELISSL